MREIKFRGKDIRNNKWRYGDFIRYSEVKSTIIENLLDTEEWYDVDSKTIGQYTGLKDKNGKEIYEGDILKVPVRRCGNNYSNWWQDKNKNHGWIGDFVYKKVAYIVSKCSSWTDNMYSGFSIQDLPITKKQVEEIRKPREKERTKQNVDTINFKIEQCEVIGNIHDNPELLEVQDE